MKKVLGSLLIVMASLVSVQADEIVVFNFNDSNLVADRGAGTLTTTFPAANVTFFGGTATNARMGDTAGQALALVNSANNGGNLTLNASTLGFNSIIVSFATQRTSTGFNNNQFQFSTDGVNFTDFGAPFNPPTSFTPAPAGLFTFNLSVITGLNNNPLAAFRIVFNDASSATGNNRIDNLIVEGTPISTAAPIPEPATMVLLVTGLTGVAASVRRRRRAV